jgi:hypothetical protein
MTDLRYPETMRDHGFVYSTNFDAPGDESVSWYLVTAGGAVVITPTGPETVRLALALTHPTSGKVWEWSVPVFKAGMREPAMTGGVVGSGQRPRHFTRTRGPLGPVVALIRRSVLPEVTRFLLSEEGRAVAEEGRRRELRERAARLRQAREQLQSRVDEIAAEMAALGLTVEEATNGARA